MISSLFVFVVYAYVRDIAVDGSLVVVVVVVVVVEVSEGRETDKGAEGVWSKIISAARCVGMLVRVMQLGTRITLGYVAREHRSSRQCPECCSIVHRSTHLYIPAYAVQYANSDFGVTTIREYLQLVQGSPL